MSSVSNRKQVYTILGVAIRYFRVYDIIINYIYTLYSMTVYLLFRNIEVAIRLSRDMTAATTVCVSRPSRPAGRWRHRQLKVSPAAPSKVELCPDRPPLPSAVGDAADGCSHDLVCFMASHTKTADRAEVFALTLRSIGSQLPGPPPLHISWSSSPHARSAVHGVLASSSWTGLCTWEQEQPCSQFEHLRALVRRAQQGPSPPPTWVFFADDDDLWSEQRYELFRRECRNAPVEASVLVCTRKARPSTRGLTIDASPALPDAPSVRAALASGVATLTDLERFNVTVESFNMDEYFDYAVGQACP